MVSGRRRVAGDSGAGSEVSSLEMNPDAADGDGAAGGEGDPTDEMMIDDLDDIFKPLGSQASLSKEGGESSSSFTNVPSGILINNTITQFLCFIF